MSLIYNCVNSPYECFFEAVSSIPMTKKSRQQMTPILFEESDRKKTLKEV